MPAWGTSPPEISNPLGIIAGYSERSLDRLGHGLDDSTAQYLNKSVRIICDEAFRCKEITNRLLMLARPGEEARRLVSIPELAREVIASVGGLKRFADRQIAFDAEPADELRVHANEGELRQVILNLLVNALEAVAPGVGIVRVSIHRSGEQIEISVTDNGHGMDPATVSRVFEPFFTEKRGQRPGTGLGLSVAHAIIRRRGGTAALLPHDRGSRVARRGGTTIILAVAAHVPHPPADSHSAAGRP